MQPMITIGDWIRRERTGQHLSQLGLALALGKHQTAISGWELGRTDVSRADLLAIGAALHVSDEALLEAMHLPVRSSSATASEQAA